MGETALLAVVPEAEPLVADLRARYDPAAAEGVPAHVTILIPFMPLDELTPPRAAQLAAALRAATPAFRFRLARLGRFERTCWLAPEPAAPFVALTQAVMAAFPGWRPYGGAFDTIVPHLTAADGDAAHADAAARELAPRLARRVGVDCRCSAVELFENRAGRWHRVRSFALVHARGPNPVRPAAA